VDLRDPRFVYTPPAAPAAPPSRVIRVDAGWASLAVGIGLALLLGLAPPLRFMGWLIRSLFHETGHVIAAWLGGCPAYPAISLHGHAAAYHKPQTAAIAALVGLLVVVLAVLAFRSRRLRGPAVALLATWVLLTFVRPLREMTFLLAGHLGEVGFEGFFLWRARTGEGVERGLERPLYACLGWTLAGSAALLALGLLFSESSRAGYATSGSFGLENDLSRVANEHLHSGLGPPAILILVAAVACVAAGLLVGRRRST
jgi:hypothetical protein